MTGNLVGYILRVRRLKKQFGFSDSSIITMDETSVSSEMVWSINVEQADVKDVPLKTVGYEKARVSVCLTAKGNGAKLKLFIGFAGAKWKSKSFHNEFKS